MKNSLVSVIVPVYNVMPYISKCVESICMQSYRNLEIILVDDGSTDGCREIIDEYAKRDNRISVVYKENGGQGSARNCGLKICKGEYITFLDSDDAMLPDCISKLVELCETCDCEIAICNYFLVTPTGENLGVWGEGKKVQHFSDAKITHCSGIEATENMLYQTHYDVNVWAKLYKRELWDGVFFDESQERIGYEDLATIYKVSLKAKKTSFLDYPLIEYLIRSDSAVRKPFEKRKVGMLDVLEEIRDYCIRNNIPILKSINCRIVAISFMLAITMKRDGEYDEEQYYRCIENIKRNRIGVLFDRKARRKTRLGALLFFCGMRCVSSIYSFLKKKKPAY